MHTSGERLHDGEVVRRAIQIQRAIDGFKGEPFTFTMMLKQTELPKGTLHRYLTIFVEEGVLERDMRFRTYRQVPAEYVKRAIWFQSLVKQSV